MHWQKMLYKDLLKTWKWRETLNLCNVPFFPRILGSKRFAVVANIVLNYKGTNLPTWKKSHNVSDHHYLPWC